MIRRTFERIGFLCALFVTLMVAAMLCAGVMIQAGW